MKFLIAVLMFFILVALLIISNNKLAFYRGENIQKFSELYLLWMSGVYSNLVSAISHVAGLKWLP